MDWYPLSTAEMESYRGQEVEGAFDIIVYIGRSHILFKCNVKVTIFKKIIVNLIVFPPKISPLYCACTNVILCLSARYVYRIPDWFHHLLMTGRILFKSTLEHYLQLFIEQKLEQVTQEHRVVSLIHLLRGMYVLIFVLLKIFALDAHH